MPEAKKQGAPKKKKFDLLSLQGVALRDKIVFTKNLQISEIYKNYSH